MTATDLVHAAVAARASGLALLVIALVRSRKRKGVGDVGHVEELDEIDWTRVAESNFRAKVVSPAAWYRTAAELEATAGLLEPHALAGARPNDPNTVKRAMTRRTRLDCRLIRCGGSPRPSATLPLGKPESRARYATRTCRGLPLDEG